MLDELAFLSIFTCVLKKKLIAEAFGTFTLVFAGCGAIVINDVSNGAITHVGVALTFGLVVMAMIYSVGGISGAHINPAVTIAFAFAKRFPKAEVLPYLLAQVAGAIVACLLLKLLFLEHETLGATLPAGPQWQSFLLELILTLILMFTILAVTAGDNASKLPVGIIVGGVVGLEAMFAGPICGASMNPARSIGPALVSMNLADLWIYIAATTIGALIAVPLCACMGEKDCCCKVVGLDKVA